MRKPTGLLRLLGAGALAATVGGCSWEHAGDRGSAVRAPEHPPLVRAPLNEAGPGGVGDGGWLAQRGLFVDYRDGRRFSVLFALHNRSSSTVTIAAASGQQSGHRLLRRVGVQLQVARLQPTSDFSISCMKSWSNSAAVPVAVPPQRDACVQFEFIMGDCRFFDPGTRLTYNRSTLITYRTNGRTFIMPLDLTGDQVTVTAPRPSVCPGGSSTRRSQKR